MMSETRVFMVEPIPAWVDQQGKAWTTRDGARARNVELSILASASDYLRGLGSYGQIEVDTLTKEEVLVKLARMLAPLAKSGEKSNG